MSFEERFANFGRRLDDLVWSFKMRSGSGDRMRGVRDAVAERVRTAKEGAGEQIDRVKYMHLPDTTSETSKGWRIAGIVVACVLCTSLGIFVGPRLFGTTQHRLSEEELAAMEKLRQGTSRTTLFTPAPETPAEGEPARRERQPTSNPLFGPGASGK
ncbi:MAG: hypothetical protein ACK5ZG_09510 [Phycisphaerae bacterium]|jgi:hypothetical protein